MCSFLPYRRKLVVNDTNTITHTHTPNMSSNNANSRYCNICFIELVPNMPRTGKLLIDWSDFWYAHGIITLQEKRKKKEISCDKKRRNELEIWTWLVLLHGSLFLVCFYLLPINFLSRFDSVFFFFFSNAFYIDNFIHRRDHLISKLLPIWKMWLIQLNCFANIKMVRNLKIRKFI